MTKSKQTDELDDSMRPERLGTRDGSAARQDLLDPGRAAQLEDLRARGADDLQRAPLALVEGDDVEPQRAHRRHDVLAGPLVAVFLEQDDHRSPSGRSWRWVR